MRGGTTVALCNIEVRDERDAGRECYPIENMIRILAKRDSVYVMAVFDCSRINDSKGGRGGS